MLESLVSDYGRSYTLLDQSSQPAKDDMHERCGQITRSGCMGLDIRLALNNFSVNIHTVLEHKFIESQDNGFSYQKI